MQPIEKPCIMCTCNSSTIFKIVDEVYSVTIPKKESSLTFPAAGTIFTFFWCGFALTKHYIDSIPIPLQAIFEICHTLSIWVNSEQSRYPFFGQLFHLQMLMFIRYPCTQDAHCNSNVKHFQSSITKSWIL